MANVAERNNTSRYYVNTMLSAAKEKDELDFHEFGVNSQAHQLLTELIEVKAKGFRGVVVTALTGLHIDKSYNPLNDFYGCNPRSIFESGIWYALQENGVPCGKSDPLNVAKNAYRLNEEWAEGKRPQSAAIAVVKYLRLIMSSKPDARSRLIDYFFFRLLKYSETIKDFQLVEIASDYSNQTVCYTLVDYTLKYPESGQLPQYLVGQLMSTLFRSSNKKVFGGNDSVFGTNTTSKKPADIWFEMDDNPVNLFEVTVKPVSLKRLDDCIEVLQSTGNIGVPVTFICRIHEDVKELCLEKGSFEYKGKRFDFVDYKNFCVTGFSLLSEEECKLILKNVASFVSHVNISLESKKGWNESFKK